jgi:hypothetical protein
MADIEIGNNLVMIISLIVNAVVVPWLAIKHRECTKLNAQKDNPS